MSDTIEPLIVDLVSWVAKEERSYLDVMEAWRTSCPRLPVWEEANARGLIARVRAADGTPRIRVTETGYALIGRTAP